MAKRKEFTRRELRLMRDKYVDGASAMYWIALDRISGEGAASDRIRERLRVAWNEVFEPLDAKRVK